MIKRIRKFLRSQAGFTLVELMIVMIILGILAAVTVPIYRTNVKKAMASEGAALVGSIRTGERVYYAENGQYLPIAKTTSNKDICVDTAGNTFFKTFTVTCTDPMVDFTGSTTGSVTCGENPGPAAGITVTIDQDGNISYTGL